jgi:hypothetical protein
VINEADLRELSPGQRRQLARSLAAIDYPHPLLELSLSRGRKLGAAFSIVSCTVLVGWIIVLVLTLHRDYTATHWRLAWIGFDMVLLAAFAVTGWAFWHGRQIVIACLLVTAALLCCDAWFDVILDLGTSGEWMSVASAVVVELPLAFLMLRAARRLIRLSALVAMSEAGGPEAVPPLWRIPLLAQNQGSGASRVRSGGKYTEPDVAPGLPASLALRPWQPISPRKPQPTPLSRASPRAQTRDCARSLAAWCGICTRSPARSS